MFANEGLFTMIIYALFIMNRKIRQMIRNIRKKWSTNYVVMKRICKYIINKRSRMRGYSRRS